MAEKPSVLIIGGLGYIGRFLALHIHKNNLASEVRVVDKVLPQLAWLAPEFDEACAGDKFMQADASRERELPLCPPPECSTHHLSHAPSPVPSRPNHAAYHLHQVPANSSTWSGSQKH